MQEPHALLTTAQAADFLGLRPQTLRGWRLLGFGPQFFRPGRSSRTPAKYRLTDLQKFLESRCFRSTSQETLAENEAQK